jgi:hypothetical protein
MPNDVDALRSKLRGRQVVVGSSGASIASDTACLDSACGCALLAVPGYDSLCLDDSRVPSHSTYHDLGLECSPQSSQQLNVDQKLEILSRGYQYRRVVILALDLGWEIAGDTKGNTETPGEKFDYAAGGSDQQKSRSRTHGVRGAPYLAP